MGALAGLLTMAFGLVYQFQRVVRSDVLDRYGVDETLDVSPLEFDVPQQTANFLNQNIDQGKVIETWERELGILTDRNYHYPDQVMLAQVHSRLYRGENNVYGLGDEYFLKVRPDYLVLGWYSRLNEIYDMATVNKYGKKIATVGSGEWRYDIYKLEFP
jgi:hypothetical protein